MMTQRAAHVTPPRGRLVPERWKAFSRLRTALGAPVLRSREYTSIGPPAIMNSLRIASRAALRARPAAIRAPLQRRGYAEAVNDKASRPVALVPSNPAPHPMELSH